jgi:hypothetical protein
VLKPRVVRDKWRYQPLLGVSALPQNFEEVSGGNVGNLRNLGDITG